MKQSIHFYWQDINARIISKTTWLDYSACGPFTKNEGGIEKFKETGDTNYIYKMILIKLVFSMVWLMVNIKI